MPVPKYVAIEEQTKKYFMLIGRVIKLSLLKMPCRLAWRINIFVVDSDYDIAQKSVFYEPSYGNV